MSATQRPLEEVARFLGGAEGSGFRVQGSAGLRRGPDENVTEEVTELRREAEAAVEIDAVLMSAASDDGVKPDVGVDAPRYRPVTVVNAGARKMLELTVEVPVEDMARLGEIEEQPSGPASPGAEADFDLAVDLSAAAGDYSRADFDADLCECAAGGGAAGWCVE